MVAKNVDMKKCNKCGELKPRSSEYFHKDKYRKDGFCYTCRVCCPNYRNKEKERKQRRKYHKNNPDVFRNLKLKHRYGITLEEYNNMIKIQNGKCKICGTSSKKLCVDHNHTTKQIRGLLCDNCNSGLGFFYDNPSFLKYAIDYLGEYNES